MKKVTVFIDDDIKAEIQRQAKTEERSFAAFLRRFLKNHFAVSAPSPSAVASVGQDFTKGGVEWASLSEEGRKEYLRASGATTGGPIVIVPTPPEYRAPTPQNPLS